MNLEEFYAQIGGDYADTLQRLCNENMVKKFVKKYQDDPTCADLHNAALQQDWEAAFRGAHTLKGVAQNLGFERLYQVSAVLTEAMRGEKPLEDRSLLDAWSSRMPQSAERFRSLSKSKGRTVWFVLLRLSKNFVFRTVSRSKPRFRAKPKKNRALRAHFFFPCINSEIHAPGIYEFASQILFYACCRTKRKNYNNTFLTASKGRTVWFVLFS